MTPVEYFHNNVGIFLYLELYDVVLLYTLFSIRLIYEYTRFVIRFIFYKDYPLYLHYTKYEYSSNYELYTF